MGLVHAMVRDFQQKAYLQGLTLAELMQEGFMGLICAAELFDPGTTVLNLCHHLDQGCLAETRNG